MHITQKLAVLPLAGLLMAAAPAPSPPQAADPDAPQPVSVAIRPGAAREPVLKYLVKPYADATGTTLDTPAFDGSLDAAKAMASAGKLDLALVDGPTLEAGCRAQVFARLDWSALGRDRYFAPAASDCGAGATIGATVLAWDQAKLHATPSWSDFWDVAKLPGRRGLQKTARRTLEIALMADGVAPADVYRVLRSSDGVDRAFRKLDQLKPYVEWWDQPGQPAQFLASGKVLMTSAPAATLPAGARAHLGLQWGGCLDETTSWAVAQGAKHARGALAVIGLAADPARQAEFARTTGLGPATKAGFALLPEDARAQNPSLPAHLQACLPLDESFWTDADGKLEARFTAWLGK
jgi:putative spermidine/putrescine transport system substrate-binding protein